MNAQELIDRYIHAVGKHLPSKNRQDVQKELRSLLLDALEERAGFKEPTLQHAVEMLDEFGPPEKMAEQYHAKQALIGDSLFPSYKLVLQIAVSVISVFYVVILGVVFWQSDSAEILPNITNWLSEYINRMLAIVGGITIAFAGLEHFWGGSFAQPEAENWNPLTLPGIDDPQEINRFKLAASIISGFVFMSAFVLLISPGGMLRPIFDDAFMLVLPWLIASTAVELSLKVLVLARGQWTRGLRWLELAQQLFSLYVVGRVVMGGRILAYTGVPDPIKVGFAIAFIVIAIDVLIKFGRMLRNRSTSTEWQNQANPA